MPLPDKLDKLELPPFSLTGTAKIDLSAAEGEAKRPTFTMTAYTGGALNVGFGRPVIVDLAGLRAANPITILLNHDFSQIVGQSSAVAITARDVSVAGTITGDDAPAQTVLSHARNGFQWPVSVGVSIAKLEAIGEKTKCTVNGQEFEGPCYIVRAGTLRETSFVGIGADERASATVAAAHEKLWNQYIQTKAIGEITMPEPTPTETLTAKAVDTEALKLAAAKGERERLAKVEAACKGIEGEQAVALKARAINAEIDMEQLHAGLLDIVRSQRANAPAVIVPDRAASSLVLEAAMRLNAPNHDGIEKEYEAKTLEAAGRYRRMGIRDFVRCCCEMEGRTVPAINATASEWMTAAFSTASTPGILSNAANKTLLASYAAVPSVARRVARQLSANDFKTHTGYRLTGDPTLKKVGQDGELQHMSLNEASFTYKVETFGRRLGITRQMFINDDLGAFLALPQNLGRGAGLSLEKVFWTLVLANTGNFFHSNNKNYISGATTVLSPAGLQQGEQTFIDQVDADGNPINVIPKLLVVPSGLSDTARRLMMSTTVNTGGASSETQVPNANTWANRFSPEVSPYLNNATLTGYSTTAWYLFGDPADVAAFGIAFLNGSETPVIEEVAADADFLGRAWRAYFDFGVCQIDPRGAIKSKGAA